MKNKEVTPRSLHSFQKTLLLFFCQMEGPDRDLIAKAHAFYEKQDIHPFTVMDVMPYPPKRDWEKPMLTIHLITGGVKNVEVDEIDPALLPYLVVITGAFPEGGYNHTLPGFFDLHCEQRDARRAWQKTHAVTLDKIDFHVARFLRIVHRLQAYEGGEAARKNALRKYRERWAPYVVQKKPAEVTAFLTTDEDDKFEAFVIPSVSTVQDGK